MDWKQTAAEAAFIAEGFAFSNSARMDVRLAYRTLGAPAPGHDNAVLMLHGTTGSGKQFLQPAFADAMFGPGGPLDIREHFIILPDAIGHGGSSKPSDGMGQSFPRYGYADMVAAQHRLVTKELRLHRLRLVMGASMGGMQTWMWGGRYPEMMDALMPVASLPECVTGRNLLWRRLLLQMARLGEPDRPGTPPHGLGPGMGVVRLCLVPQECVVGPRALQPAIAGFLRFATGGFQPGIVRPVAGEQEGRRRGEFQFDRTYLLGTTDECAALFRARCRFARCRVDGIPAAPIRSPFLLRDDAQSTGNLHAVFPDPG